MYHRFSQNVHSQLWQQKGINAVVDTAEEDSVVWHANDTLESGCFLEKEEDVRNLCEKAPEHLKWLTRWEFFLIEMKMIHGK